MRIGIPDCAWVITGACTVVRCIDRGKMGTENSSKDAEVLAEKAKLKEIYFKHYLDSTGEKSRRQEAAYASALKGCICYTVLSILMSLGAVTFLKYRLVATPVLCNIFISLIPIFFGLPVRYYMHKQAGMLRTYAVLNGAAFKKIQDFCTENNLYDFYCREYAICKDNPKFTELNENRLDTLYFASHFVLGITLVISLFAQYAI